MPEMHINPGPNEALILPCTKSAKTGGIQNMTMVVSSVIVVCGPIPTSGASPSTKTTTLAATPMGSTTATLLTLVHQFAADEFTVAQGFKAGAYLAWPIHTLEDGTTVQGQPLPFKLKNPWENLSN